MFTMGKLIDQVHVFYDECHAKAKSTYEGCRSSLIADPKFYSKKVIANCLRKFGVKEKCEKSPDNGYNVSRVTEPYRVVQVFAVALCTLGLCYLSVRYGKMAFSLLQNGKIVHGTVPKKAVVIFSLGYSVPHSIVLSAAACLLIYSLVSKKANWTLPFIFIYLTDLILDVGDAMVAIFLYFTYLRPIIAFFYTADTILIILIEVWIWLGVYKQYKSRMFKVKRGNKSCEDKIIACE